MHLQPDNRTMKYQQLFNDIDTGKMKIPKFQREFVWSKQQTSKLIDSIIKGFPIGTFILWQTKDGLRSVKNVGNAELPDTPKGDSAYYVLDGQQRMTSLYAVRKGLIITKDGKGIDYKDICIDLTRNQDEDESVVFTDPLPESKYISVHKLLTASLRELIAEYESSEIELIDVYKTHLTGYDFSIIVIAGYPLDIACEVFTRINTGGTELTLFEIMVAKTYDEKKKFDFSVEYDILIEGNNDEKGLDYVGYGTLPHSTVLQCVAACICKQIRRKDILKLDKSKFIKKWPVVKEAIEYAVDYLKQHLRVPVSRLLPYNSILVPLAYFFVKNENQGTSNLQNKLITQYFWWASLTNRFTSGSEGKIAADLKRMDMILKGKKPSYKGEEYEPDVEGIMWKWFSAGDSFCKAILCLFSYFQPKSFRSGSQVVLDNSWLKMANSRNYHHFFPRAYLRAQGWGNDEANSIMNITFVDDYLNKRKIKAKAPSKYMKEFAKENGDIDSIMKSHLITNMNTFGVWQNDYEEFLKKRAKKVCAELKKRLQPNI